MEGTFKRCFKCGLTLPITAFYKGAKMKDGHLNICKECQKKAVHERYEVNRLNPEYMEKERARAMEKFKRLYSGTDRQRNKHGTNDVRKYVERRVGKLPRSIELHHWNYNQMHSTIGLERCDHSRLHRLITLDKSLKIFVVKETGEKLDTMEKHLEFVKSRFNVQGVFDY